VGKTGQIVDAWSATISDAIHLDLVGFHIPVGTCVTGTSQLAFHTDLITFKVAAVIAFAGLLVLLHTKKGTMRGPLPTPTPLTQPAARKDVRDTSSSPWECKAGCGGIIRQWKPRYPNRQRKRSQTPSSVGSTPTRGTQGLSAIFLSPGCIKLAESGRISRLKFRLSGCTLASPIGCPTFRPESSAALRYTFTVSKHAGLQNAAIQTESLCRNFGDKRAVDNVTFEIPLGTFYGICGPNGAGKTTALKMATGLLRPTSGTVAVTGIDVWADPVAAKRHFGFVPDNPQLFDRLNAAENLAFIGALRDLSPGTVAKRSEEILSALDMEKDRETLLADYSLGMTKRIGLAAAILHNPRVLILDEPFGSLDPVNTAVMEELLQLHVKGGGTVVFSSHVMDVVERLCDRIVIIDEGKIKAEGTIGKISGGKRLQDAFVDLVGGRALDDGSMKWFGSSSD
jgi:ABC-2 type transport system ATP-binding protein